MYRQEVYGKKEEGSVLAVINVRQSYRSGECSSEIVETQRDFGLTLRVVEPIVRVSCVVSEVFEQGAGIPLGAGTADQIDLSARQMSKLRSVRRRLYLELFKSLW